VVGSGRSPFTFGLSFTCCVWTNQACSVIEHMTRDQIQTAIKEGIPFEIKMADGAKYRVRERYQVAVGRTSVVVFDDKDLAHILPLLTMTGITYLKPDAKR